MSDFNLEEGETIYNIVNESIYITKTTPQFITCDIYDDSGEIWRRNLKRKVFYNDYTDYLYIKTALTYDDHIHILKYNYSLIQEEEEEEEESDEESDEEEEQEEEQEEEDEIDEESDEEEEVEMCCGEGEECSRCN